MSRLTKKPVKLLPGVTFAQDGSTLIFKGPQGEKKLQILPFTKVKVEGENVIIGSDSNDLQARANGGTMWALVRNAVQGVAKGFSKVLEINGVGYRANVEGKDLVLSLGYANPIRFTPPPEVTVMVEKNLIKISGVDKELVGRAAAEIRAFKKPEPYKGKGIRYQDEVIRRKAGKKPAPPGAGAP